MYEGVNIKLELGINAQKFIQQVQMHHEQLETQIEEGVKLALDDLSKENFVEYIRQTTLKEFKSVISSQITSYQFRQKIEKTIFEKIDLKLDKYAEEIAEKVTENIKNLNA